MPMTTLSDREPVYEAAQLFVDRALRADDSLFSPGRLVWAEPALDDMYHRFVEQPDTSNLDFFARLQQQLYGARPETIQLAAELLFVHFLISSDIYPTTKLNYIEKVLQWLPEPVTTPEPLRAACASGIAKVGTAFHTLRFQQLRFLLGFVRHWKSLSSAERQEALADPWTFERLVDTIPVGSAYAQRNALLHLVYPGTFEPIVSRDYKRAIAQAFATLVDNPTADLERQLAQIRDRLIPRYGNDFQFYRADVKQRWLPDDTPWGKFSAWAANFFYWTDFDKVERDYKRHIAENLRQARKAIGEGTPDWLTPLKKAFGPPNNLTSYYTHSPFLAWCAENPERARAALYRFWESELPIAERIENFGEDVPRDARNGGMLMNLASFLAMAIDETRYPIYLQRVYERGLALTGYPAADDVVGEPLYEHYLSFLDQILVELKKRRIPVRDRLDAQGLLYSVTKWKAEHEPVVSWPEDEREKFLTYQKGGDTVPVPPDVPDAPNALAELAERLMLDESFLRRIAQLIRVKRQVIFYGPPGTGKTYVARELAKVLAAPNGTVELIQFHPSYAYEDFVEGYRPVPSQSDQPTFSLVPGPLKRIANVARENPEATHVLIIDEINRGNLSKLFGELFFLLEYRDQAISLQYSAEPFSLPENLWIIGTMNTADRSIAILDAALRRRFSFVPFFPTEEPLAGLLERWLEAKKPDLVWVARVVNRANALLADRHAAIGPSYFLRQYLDEEWISLIWEHDILPTLAERFFGDEARLADFALTKLRNANSSGA